MLGGYNLMKTIFRNLGLGVLMAGCVAVTATTRFRSRRLRTKLKQNKRFTDNLQIIMPERLTRKKSPLKPENNMFKNTALALTYKAQC